MSELCNSKCHFYNLLLSDLILLCSFILSHPLYLSYFIFFSPYLLKLVSFLSPLFITTSLLSLAFLTAFVHENFLTESVYNCILKKIWFKQDIQNEFQSFDDLGIYEILFGSSVMEEREISEDKSEEESLQFSDCEDLIVEENDNFTDNKAETNPICEDKSQISSPKMEEKRLENFLKILDEFERLSSNAGAKIDKVVAKPKAEKLSTIGSDADCNNKINAAIGGGKERAHSQRVTSKIDRVESEEFDRKSSLKAESSRALMEVNSYGSMRKEKEWKRTLACKLFEERHGGDGMDSLWEAYEIDSDKSNAKQKIDPKKKKNSKSSIGIHEEDDEIGAQLCCLQALKLSTGKMNLGMGRPNLVKISKAIKGFGWLHHVSKHSKKVHNNNGDRY